MKNTPARKKPAPAAKPAKPAKPAAKPTTRKPSAKPAPAKERVIEIRESTIAGIAGYADMLSALCGRLATLLRKEYGIEPPPPAVREPDPRRAGEAIAGLLAKCPALGPGPSTVCCRVLDFDARHRRWPVELRIGSGDSALGTVRVNLREDYAATTAAARRLARDIAALKPAPKPAKPAPKPARRRAR